MSALNLIAAMKSTPKGSCGDRPQACFPLLHLPTETRELILRQLLHSEETLRYHGAEHVDLSDASFVKLKKRNYTFYPEILRTCKQLHAEGALLLQRENVLGVDVWLSYQGPHVTYMGDQASFERFQWEPSSPASFTDMVKTSKLIEVAIYVMVPDDDNIMNEGVFERHVEEIREKAHDLCEQLIKGKQQLSKTRMKVTWVGRKPSANLNPSYIGEKVLNTFTMLRPKSVVINGFSPGYTEKLTKSMLSSKPALDLFVMQKAVEKWIMTDPDYKYEDEQYAIDKAMYECDVEAFKNARDQIVRRAEADLLKMCKYERQFAAAQATSGESEVMSESEADSEQ